MHKTAYKLAHNVHRVAGTAPVTTKQQFAIIFECLGAYRSQRFNHCMLALQKSINRRTMIIRYGFKDGVHARNASIFFA
jgi:hypothetical protein